MKHKMWSRLLSMALAVMMISSIVPNSAFAEAASEITNSTSQVQVEETPVVENDVPQDEVIVPEEETPAVEAPVESVEPTVEPTAEPTAEPTQAPEATTVPSEQPSTEPTATPEATEAPNASAQPSESPAPSATPAPSASPLPSETPVPTETPAATEEPAIDGQALLDELLAIEDDEAFMKAVNELTEEQIAALEALGKDALADYTLRVESLTAPEETVELNAEAKEFTTVVEGVDGVTVTVKVPEGALPVDAELKASMIDQSSEEYAKAEEALADENLNEQPAEYDGMIALDIRFEVGGQEVEPLKEVEVSIDAQALLPESADPETVAVQHLKEDATGEVVAVETVADASEETGEVTVEAAPAEEAALNVASTFAVDGFSTFTIIFNNNKTLSFTYWDTDGNKLDDKNLNFGPEKLESDQVLNIAEYAPAEITIDGQTYIYQSAALIDRQAGNIRRVIDRVGYVDGHLRVYGNFFDTSTGMYTIDYDNPDLRLIYGKKESGSTGDVQTDVVLNAEKKTTYNEANDTYDLQLSISGQVGSLTNPAKVDVLFVIDQSGSMDTQDTGIPGQTRSKAAGVAVGKLADSLAKNENLDVRYSVVSFGDEIASQQYYNDAKIRQYWTSDPDAVEAAATVSNPSGGTNYQAGLLSARTLLVEARPDAQKYVIFLSDGMPTIWYNSKGESYSNYKLVGTWKTGTKPLLGLWWGSENGNNIKDGWKQAKSEAGNITNVNGFFGILLGNSEKVEGYNPEDVLQGICDSVYNACGGEAKVEKENFQSWRAYNSNELEEKFAAIEASITTLLCDKVTVEDTLSQWVVPVSENGNPTLTILDDRGIATEVNGVYASYDKNTKKLSINFPPKYKLQAHYTYQVSMQIKVSDEAYAEYQQNGYPENNISNKNTGDHSEKKGFYSNKSASVTYTYNNEEQTTAFPQPVVWVHPGELKITKKIDGDILSDDAKLDALKEKLKFRVTLNDKELFELQLTGDPDQDGVYTITDNQLKNLKPGTTYKIEEIGFDVEGYDCETTINGEENATISGVISASTQDTVKFVNDYTALDGKLTFTKTLEGLCDGNTMALFTVEIKDGDGNSYYKTLKFNGTGDQSFTITLPVGSYQIRELSNLGYTNGEIKQGGETLEKNGDYYNFTITPGGKTNLTVTNTANNNNFSKIDKDTAVNHFTNGESGWTWERQ